MYQKIRFCALVLAFGLLLPPSILSVSAQKKDIVNNEYIVVLKDTVINPEAVTDELSKKYTFIPNYIYKKVIKGFAATLNKATIMELQLDSRVQFLSQDQEVSINSTGGSALGGSAESSPSGIMRIGKPVSGHTGAGVGVAILDTGIDVDHTDLTANLAADSKSCLQGVKTATDDNGHGTHLAGIVAALHNKIGVVGVAPEVKLFAVKVLDSQGNGTWSSVICGLDWISTNASSYGIKIVNIGFSGGGVSDNNCGKTNHDALHKAICRSRDMGVVYVAPAGDEGKNTANFVPAAYDDAVITVSALTETNGSADKEDTVAPYSNYGTEIDIAAPGTTINSTYKGDSYKNLSGTEIAAAHVTGAVALYHQLHTNHSWTQIRDGLISLGENIVATSKHAEKLLRITRL